MYHVLVGAITTQRRLSSRVLDGRQLTRTVLCWKEVCQSELLHHFVAHEVIERRCLGHNFQGRTPLALWPLTTDCWQQKMRHCQKQFFTPLLEFGDAPIQELQGHRERSISNDG